MTELSILAEKLNINELLISVSNSDVGERRESLNALEQRMLIEEQVEIPVGHKFIDGMYMREITIPEGTLLTGRIHKFDHFDIMLSGDISVSSDDGTVKRLTGLNIMEGKAGKKRAGYAHEDTHWITVHSAKERNPEEMYEFLTCATFGELNDFNISLDRADYRNMIESIGMTEEDIRIQVENTEDQISDPEHYQGCYELKESPINGTGVFAKIDLEPGDLVAIARLLGKRTPTGRYTNHAFRPNSVMNIIGKDVELRVVRHISKGEEITVNYREVLDHRAERGDLCQP